MQSEFYVHAHLICDWIYGNSSKLHIGSYEIIDFNNQPRIVSTRVKLTQKVDYSLCLRASLALTSCCSQKFPPNNLKIGWLYYQGCFYWVGGGGWTSRKGQVQNCGRALVKPKNQSGGTVLAL